MLSKGLDNGDIIFHCIPMFIVGDTAFDFTMGSIAVGHDGLSKGIVNKDLLKRPGFPQTKEMEIRYTRNRDFTDEVAKGFLNRSYFIQASELSYTELLNPLFF